jgi:sorbitol-specific phosphotransferase system component IIA
MIDIPVWHVEWLFDSIKQASLVGEVNITEVNPPNRRKVEASTIQILILSTKNLQL